MRVERQGDGVSGKQFGMANLSDRTIRAGITALTVAAMVFGHISEASCPECPLEDRGLVANGLFFGLLAIDLVPSLIYLVGMKSRRSLIGWGLALLGLSAVPWILGILVNEVFLLLVYLSYPVLLVGILVMTVKEHLPERSN